MTIEENVLPGGFGSAVLEHLEDAFAEAPGERARVLRVGLPDAYVTQRGGGGLEHLEDAFAEVRPSGRGYCASASPTATSPTASRRCCGPRPASPASRWPSGCWLRCRSAQPVLG